MCHNECVILYVLSVDISKDTIPIIKKLHDIIKFNLDTSLCKMYIIKSLLNNHEYTLLIVHIPGSNKSFTTKNPVPHSLNLSYRVNINTLP